MADGIYLNKLAASVSARDIVNELNWESYISLGIALAEWGVSSQSPAATTCVTASRGRRIRASSIEIVYRKISRELFWGFTEKKGRYRNYKIAEPETPFLGLDLFYIERWIDGAVRRDSIREAEPGDIGGVREKISVDGSADAVFSDAGGRD